MPRSPTTFFKGRGSSSTENSKVFAMIDVSHCAMSGLVVPHFWLMFENSHLRFVLVNSWVLLSRQNAVVQSKKCSKAVLTLSTNHSSKLQQIVGHNAFQTFDSKEHLGRIFDSSTVINILWPNVKLRMANLIYVNFKSKSKLTMVLISIIVVGTPSKWHELTRKQ